ncbi:hypothetical protein ACI797_11500 [Geodermatophilus sp. SYSU D00691]
MTSRPGSPADLTVRVSGVPDPFRLRGAVADRLAGRPVPTGPEAELADAVAAHLWETYGLRSAPGGDH